MKREALLSHRIIEGKVSVYRRPDVDAWQCSYRLGGKLYRKSTKCDDLAEAKEAAAEIYVTARVLHKQGIPIVSKSFKSVAQSSVSTMQRALDNGTGKPTYVSYIQSINKWLIPFFGSRSINNIDGIALAAFSQFREMTLGKRPSYNLVNTHICAFNRIFDTAIERGYMTRSQVPEIKNTGEKGERRPTFERYEYTKLYQFMKNWVKEGKAGVVTARRRLLREYIFFLTNTGVRPGTETDGLKWNHITTVTDKGIEYIQIYVYGKTKGRLLIARHSIRRYLKRLAAMNPKFDGLTLNQIIELRSDDFVFRMPNGKECKEFSMLLKSLLTEAGLLIDPMTQQPRVLYSFRHFYATLALRHGQSVYTLANNMGTSVEQIKNHYSHITNAMMAHTLAGKTI